MIYFDNLQAFATISTHPLSEAIMGVLEVANVHKFQTRERPYLLNDGASSGTWLREGNYWSCDGSIVDTLAVCETEGGIVVDILFPDNGVVLFGEGGTSVPTYGIGVNIISTGPYTGSIRFVDQDDTIYQSVPITSNIYGTPCDGNYRIVLHEITTAKLEIDYKLIVVYQGLRFLAAQAFYRENDRSTELMYIRNNHTGHPSYFHVYVQEFSTPALEHSVDPGETPQASFSRVTTGLSYKMAARYDTSVNIMRPRAGMEVDIDLTDYRELSSITKIYNYDKRYSRIRAVSAYPEAEYIDPVASDQVGGQFAVTSNPNIITMKGAATEAERAQNVSDSEAEVITIEGPSCLIMEPDDLVTVDNQNWIVISGDRVIGPNGTHMSSVQLRKYTGAS